MPFTPLSRRPDLALTAGPDDVRGWDVRTMRDGECIGKIDDILLDEGGRPRYLDVDVGALRRHVLLPVGRARVDEAEDVVWIPGMTRDEVKDLPEYTQEPETLGDFGPAPLERRADSAERRRRGDRRG